MKKVFIIIALIWSLSISFAQTKVACIGDSITFGAGIMDRGTNSYPAQLQQILGNSYEVKNFGLNGTRLTKKVPLTYWESKEFDDAKKFDPDIVVVMIGTNDCWPPRWESSKDEFVPTYKELINTFASKPRPARVFVCTPPPIFDSPATIPSNIIQFSIVPLVKQVAYETGSTLININEICSTAVAMFPDKLHPNREAASLIAEEVAENISPFTATKANWKVVFVSSEEPEEGAAKNAIDGNPDTYWHTSWSKQLSKVPHELIVDTETTITTAGFFYLPRQDGGINGRIKQFEFYISQDSLTWELVKKGEFKNDSNRQRIDFETVKSFRFFKLIAISEVNGGPWTSVAEIDFRKKSK